MMVRKRAGTISVSLLLVSSCKSSSDHRCAKESHIKWHVVFRRSMVCRALGAVPFNALIFSILPMSYCCCYNW